MVTKVEDLDLLTVTARDLRSMLDTKHVSSEVLVDLCLT